MNTSCCSSSTTSLYIPIIAISGFSMYHMETLDGPHLVISRVKGSPSKTINDRTWIKENKTNYSPLGKINKTAGDLTRDLLIIIQ